MYVALMAAFALAMSVGALAGVIGGAATEIAAGTREAPFALRGLPNGNYSSPDNQATVKTGSPRSSASFSPLGA